MTTPDRRVSVAVILVGGLTFVILAALLVPWQWVPGGHALSVPADQVFSPAQIAQGEHYSSMQAHLSWASYAVSMVVALVLGLTWIGAALVGRLRGPWWSRVIIATGGLLAVGTLVTLPFAWRIQQHALDAGLSREAWSGWWQDVGLSFLVSWVPTAIALLVLVGLARRAPRRWPLWGAGIAVALGFLGSFIYPVVVEPLFNDFTSMPAGPLRSEIFHLAEIEHVHLADVLVTDASRRTTELNAYVSGFGDTRRMVIYDTLLKQLPRREVLVVVAHELGHARHQDVLVGTILGAAGGAAGVGLLGLVLASARLRRWSGTEGAADPRVVPLVLALVAVASFLISPVQNTISRAVEARADRASLAATHDYAAFIAMQRALAVSSRADPTPPRWSQLWFGTHPTALQRVGIAEALRAQRAR